MAVGHKTGGREKGTPNKTTKALKEMIVLNGHLQQRLDALNTPRRATR